MSANKGESRSVVDSGGDSTVLSAIKENDWVMLETGSGVSYLVGEPGISRTPLPPYSDEACAFLSDLSSQLLALPESRTMPDVISFAFWCRRSHINALREKYEGNESCPARMGRGLSFHVTPSNVPINFAFSFAFSLLAGNANIVRVPSRAFRQIDIMCDVLNRVLKQHPAVAKRTAFVSYPADDCVTTQFSKQADVRIIWGGDETVGRIRAMACKPRCKDIVFADRYSVAILDVAAVMQANDSQVATLADGFYNDTYLMDQNACSSAQSIFWLNSDGSDTANIFARATSRFWQAVSSIAHARYDLQASVAVEKYIKLCEDILDGTSSKSVYDDAYLYRIFLEDRHLSSTNLRGVGGYFYEMSITTLEEIVPLVDSRWQTLLYYGVDPHIIRDLVVQHRLHGIDRIVPIGSAMDIDIVWDGYDLVQEFTRVIDVR